MHLSKVILIVEHSNDLRNIMVDQLQTTYGYEVLVAGTIEDAQQVMNGEAPCVDAIVADMEMPDGDACDFCAMLRAKGHQTPFIMLTGCAGDTAAAIRALDSGANDCMRMPFLLEELAARLRSQFRVFAHSEYAAMRFGRYVFRPAGRILYDQVERRRIRLTDKEAAILKYLYPLGEDGTDRTSLLAHVWGYSPAASTHTLETHIYRLRQKIERHPETPTLLRTVKGGYCLSDTDN